MNQDFSVVILNINAHFAETGDGGKAVSSFQKMGDLCGSFGKGTEHDGTVADAIYQMFASSRDYRDSIDVVDNGPIRKAYVLYLDIADEAGGIATIATILAMDKISIKNRYRLYCL